MTSPAAPAPLPVPRQRDSSALAAERPLRVLTQEESEQRDAETEERNRVELAEHVKHVHLADRGYQDVTPVSVAGELYFDGERVALTNGVWSVTGGSLQETLLTLRVPRAAIAVARKDDDDGHFYARLYGRLVLPTDSVPFPETLGDPHDLVDVTIIVGRFSVGPRPEAE